MYTRITCRILTAAVLCGAVLPAAALDASLVDTSFTYQGFLNDAGYPVNQPVDFEFSLYDAAFDGTRIGITATVDGVDVVDGLFTAEVDLGAGVFNGGSRWLEIAVAVPAGSGSFTTLSPRQPVTATPYALQTRGIAVDDEGYVGIGTTAPSRLLEVAGDTGLDGTVYLNDPAGSSGNLQLDLTGGYEIFRDDVGAGGDGTRFWLDAPDQGEVVLGPRAGAHYLGNMRLRSDTVSFETADGGASTLKIANGKVGIGTADPGSVISSSKLDVVNGHIGLSNNYGVFSFNRDGSGIGAGMDTSTADDLYFWAGSAERFVVRADGKVGIGTTSPASKLHVSGGTASVNMVLEADTDNSGEADQPSLTMTQDGGLVTSDLGFFDAFNNFAIRSEDSGGGVSHILLQPEGNVGVGTDNPQAMLDVNGDLRVSGASGDDAVALPTGSISATETAHEPGMASYVSGETQSLGTGYNSLASRTINCPTDGYVYVTATLSFVTPAFAPVNDVYFGISTTGAFLSHADSQSWIERIQVGGAVPITNPPRMISGTFPVTAGSHTFHLVARYQFVGGVDATNVHLNIMFFPTAYGAVEGEYD